MTKINSRYTVSLRMPRTPLMSVVQAPWELLLHSSWHPLRSAHRRNVIRTCPLPATPTRSRSTSRISLLARAGNKIKGPTRIRYKYCPLMEAVMPSRPPCRRTWALSEMKREKCSSVRISKISNRASALSPRHSLAAAGIELRGLTTSKTSIRLLQHPARMHLAAVALEAISKRALQPMW